MTVYEDGRAECDGCGSDVGRGGLDEALVISDVDQVSGLVINMHFCRVNKCASKVLSRANMKHRLKRVQEGKLPPNRATPQG